MQPDQFPDLLTIAAMTAAEAAELEQRLVSRRGQLRATLQRMTATDPKATEINEQIEVLSGRIRACRRRATAAEVDSRSRRIEELEHDLTVARELVEVLQLELGRGRHR